MMSRFRGLHPTEWVVFAGGAFVILAEYFGLFFGLPMHDEAFYVVPALLTSIGGQPFFNEMFFQQTCFLLYEPLMAAWYALFGTTGIMLFARHLFFFLQIFTLVVT
ncbi:MAG: hypothetical protein V4760_02180, partial [Bdellovibrionota bacterium]